MENHFVDHAAEKALELSVKYNSTSGSYVSDVLSDAKRFYDFLLGRSDHFNSDETK
jgi:hypothetical protein